MKWIAWMTSMALAGCLACGGAGGGTTTPEPPAAPVIANLDYLTPMTVPVNTGGGAVSIGWNFNFIASGGDITSLILEELSATGTVLDSQTITPANVTGLTSGLITAAVIVDTSAPGSFPFRVHLVDSTGTPSNNLSGLFTVTAAAADSAAPEAAPSALGESAQRFKHLEGGVR